MGLVFLDELRLKGPGAISGGVQLKTPVTGFYGFRRCPVFSIGLRVVSEVSFELPF